MADYESTKEVKVGLLDVCVILMFKCWISESCKDYAGSNNIQQLLKCEAGSRCEHLTKGKPPSPLSVAKDCTVFPLLDVHCYNPTESKS